MIGLIEPRRIDDVGRLHTIHHIQQRDARGLQTRGIGNYVKLGNLASLHDDSAYSIDAIERRLQIVSSNLPKLSLRNSSRASIVRRQCIAEDRKGRKRKTVGRDTGGRGQCLGNSRKGRIGKLQSVEHIHIPIEKQADLRGTTAGSAANRSQARNGVHCIFNRLGDRHLHLFDRHDAIVDADHHTRKICVGKDRDRQPQRRIHSRRSKCDHEKKDRRREAREPEALFRCRRLRVHFSPFPASGLSSPAAPTLTLVPSSSA